MEGYHNIHTIDPRSELLCFCKLSLHKVLYKQWKGECVWITFGSKNDSIGICNYLHITQGNISTLMKEVYMHMEQHVYVYSMLIR